MHAAAVYTSFNSLNCCTLSNVHSYSAGVVFAVVTLTHFRAHLGQSHKQTDYAVESLKWLFFLCFLSTVSLSSDSSKCG